MFSCEFCQICKNTFSNRTRPVAASPHIIVQLSKPLHSTNELKTNFPTKVTLKKHRKLNMLEHFFKLKIFTIMEINQRSCCTKLFFKKAFLKMFSYTVQLSLHKKWSLPVGNSAVNVTKSAVSCGFSHSYWRNP